MIPGLFLLLGLGLATSDFPPPTFLGDPQAELHLTEPVAAALRATEAYGSWPTGPWRIHLHLDAQGFEAATAAPPQRAAQWRGDLLHLRPWEQLRRRDLGLLLRHEVVHRRLVGLRLRPWAEEARCLWAESHTHPPKVWPIPPPQKVQRQLDLALERGGTLRQAWAYRTLRAWLTHRLLPPPPKQPRTEPWQKEALSLEAPVTVCWPPERLPRRLEVNGQTLSHHIGRRHLFQGEVSFGSESPIPHLDGRVELRGLSSGWELRWTCSSEAWVAAATAGELGEAAPPEAQRALAALLHRWLEGHRDSQHPQGQLCPLTHCAVVRGAANQALLSLVRGAPRLTLDPREALFCGSKGGVSLSPQAVWGWGPSAILPALEVPNDPWGTWVRVISPRQLQALKRAVAPGLKPGQAGLRLGASGPYAVESLRIEAGRRFGWTTWPSNACTASLLPDGSLELRGRGWGHNVGLCLASAQYLARQGRSAESILEQSFGPGTLAERAP